MAARQTIRVIADNTAGAHPTDSTHLLDLWLPKLGPTATLTARLLARTAAAHPDREWKLTELSQQLGLGGHIRRLSDSLNRLARFHILTYVATDIAYIRLQLPPPTPLPSATEEPSSSAPAKPLKSIT